MTTFARNEIISSTTVVRQFSSLIRSLLSHERQKIGVIRNNEMEAVILSVDEYERLHTQAQRAEYMELSTIIGQRKETPASSYIPFEDVLKKAGITGNEL